jgi:hypothetical protein
MKVQFTPHRILPAWVPSHLHAQPLEERTEPVLGLAPIATLQETLAPRLRRADIERALDEGSQRVYGPMAETEVIERLRRR